LDWGIIHLYDVVEDGRVSFRTFVGSHASFGGALDWRAGIAISFRLLEALLYSIFFTIGLQLYLHLGKLLDGFQGGTMIMKQPKFPEGLGHVSLITREASLLSTLTTGIS
jgi:hypothetical protein